MNDTQKLYILQSLFCIAIILWIHLKEKSNRDRQQTNLLIDKIIIIFLAFLVCDLTWIFVDGRSGKLFSTLNNFINVLYMTLLSALSYEWFFLTGYGVFGKEVLRPAQKYILSIPLLTLVTLSILSTKYKIIFYIDPETNLYSRGPLIWLQQAICFFYYVSSMVIFFYARTRKHKSINKGSIPTNITFVMFPLIGGVLSIFLSSMPTTEMGITLAILFFFGDMQISHISQDPLTGVNNRHTFEKILENSVGYTPEDSKLYLFFADIDNFRNINENYNRAEGDEVLIEVAEILKKLTQNTSAVIGRYDGDEFAILRKFKTKEDAEQFKHKIIKAVEEKNNSDNRPYKVSVSVGYTVAQTESYESITRSLNKASKLMFEAQNNIHTLDKNNESI